ncbi:MAG: hypothetical protein FJ077_16200 [Cyanobacteria bacterium K_DeepCast_35m_m2_023]|nr:hypothetical protein [Cyanobacteria bacterium K_DeepCast_35m_m2_023]
MIRSSLQRSLLILASSLLLAGCTARAGIEGQAPVSRAMPAGIEVAFNHRQGSRYRSPITGQWRRGDDLEAMVLASINQAEQQILVAVQELSLPRIADALAHKHRQGVDVRVVLENTYSTPWSDQHDADLSPHLRRRNQQLRQLGWGDAVQILQHAGVPLLDDTADGSAGSGLMHSMGLPAAAEGICLCHSTFTPPQVVG